MSRNGSGTYTLPAGNPVVTGTTISSTWANNTLNDIASALTGSLSSDGQTTPSANLTMGGFVTTNVGNATLRTHYASAGQIQDSTFQYLTSVSGTDVITATAALGMTAYATGQVFRFIAAGANTGAATLNINAIGAKAITKHGASALGAGDIVSGSIVEVVYDGTEFQISSASSSVLSDNNTWTGTNTFNNDVTINTTTALKIPVGTTAQEPTGAVGKIRYNTDTSSYEGYNGSAWASLGGGATGGGTDQVFFENNQVVTTSYTIPATKNAMTTGPITVNSGVTVTVSSGSRWVVL
jgi:hypothetical protein